MIYPNTQSQGAEKLDMYTNLKSCQSFCVNSPRCVAIDFEFSLMECWVHWTNIHLVPDSTYDTENVSQYILNRTCLSQGSTLA